MSLSRDSWLPQATELDLGQKRRVKHECGTDRIMLVSRGPDGLRAWCFRCNDGGFAPPPAESLADKLERLNRARLADASILRPELPEPRVYPVDDWPPAAAVWMYKAGLGRREIGEMGAYYHPPTDRVVLPVFEGSLSVFWQARAVDGRQPKYLAPSADRSRVVPRWGSAPSPTLTEDILSAFKVGLVGEGIAVMGTRVSDHLVSILLKRAAPVNVWLDPDVAGQIGARKIMKQLRAYGLEVRNILSPRDPKLMSRDDIKELLHV
jgi:DNA primase